MQLKRKDTLIGYDRWASSYDTQENPLVAASDWVLDQVPLDAEGVDVLELGCGTGRHVSRILREGARSYLGVDGSPGMLERARQQWTDAHVQWLQSRLEVPLQIREATFDLVLVVLVLEHVTGLNALFESAARALRSGGRLRIVDIHPDLVVRGTVAHFQEGQDEVRFSSVAHPVGKVCAALEQAGLRAERVQEWRMCFALQQRAPRLLKHGEAPLLLDVGARRA